MRKNSSLTYRLLDIIQQNVEQREERGIIRKDILQLLVKFRNGNDLSSDKWQVEHAIGLWSLEYPFEFSTYLIFMLCRGG